MYSYGYDSSALIGTSIAVFIVSMLFSVGMAVAFGFITKHINENKGYTGGFAWGFFLGVIGIIVVACRSDNRTYNSAPANPAIDKFAQSPVQTDGVGWQCVCGQFNGPALMYCVRCRRGRGESVPAAPSAGSAEDAASAQAIEAIRQLSLLHDQGVLTDAEFEQKKAMLLSKVQ